MSSTIGNRIFNGFQKAITDFIIIPLYTVSIVAFLIFAKLFFIVLWSWIGYTVGYFFSKIISQKLLLGCDNFEIYSIFGIRKTFLKKHCKIIR